MTARSLILTLMLAAAPAAAQEAQPGLAARLTELPAHRALARTIETTGTPLAAFTTDGCSGGLSSVWRIVSDRFPDFSEAHGAIPPWEDCCVIHDRAYHAGGTEGGAGAGYAAREQADADLRACVSATGAADVDAIAARYDTDPESVRAAYRTIGSAMYHAVRFGGGPCSGLPWRWGYGWPQCFVATEDFRAGEN